MAKLTGRIIVCNVDEHIMFSSATAFVDAVLKWHVTHDAQKSADHLTVESDPPASLSTIRAEEFAHSNEDSEVDSVFEIPVRVAQETVGF
jgi:hypothetical protein